MISFFLSTKPRELIYAARSQNKKSQNGGYLSGGGSCVWKGTWRGFGDAGNIVSWVCSVSESSFSCTAMGTFQYVYYTFIKGWSRKKFNRFVSSIKRFSSVQFSLSVMSDSATPWTTAGQASLSITNFQSLPKLMSIESVMASNHLILCRPLLLLPPIYPIIRVFSNESALRIRWPKYRSFSFNISLSNEHPGPISSRMDWLDLLAVQGTLKSLLQHHSSKASILRYSAIFIVQLSHPYMTTGKTIALTR